MENEAKLSRVISLLKSKQSYIAPRLLDCIRYAILRERRPTTGIINTGSLLRAVLAVRDTKFGTRAHADLETIGINPRFLLKSLRELDKK